jgi:type IV fimbrial biogenesis protein FimT
MMQKAFTLIELMVTLSVIAILAAIAAPSFSDMIQDNRLIANSNTLTGALALTRSEAVKRANSVTICASSNQSSCTGDWHDGWIIFSDADEDAVVDTDDTVIQVQQGLANNVTVRFDNNRVIYQSSGFSSFNGTFVICDDRGLSNAKGLVINGTGRVKTATTTDLASRACAS